MKPVTLIISSFTAEGRKELHPIAATNGRDLDGTAILTSPSQIDNLASKGFIELRTRPVDDGVFRWVICPIPEDPRDGFIRPDAFIRDVKRADGTAVFPALGRNFRCLQQSGDWCNPYGEQLSATDGTNPGSISVFARALRGVNNVFSFPPQNHSHLCRFR